MSCITPSGFHAMGADGDCEHCGISQDALDGRALRLLREAANSDDSGLPEWSVFPEEEVWTVYCSPVHDKRECWFYGATIAEAADQCREALR